MDRRLVRGPPTLGPVVFASLLFRNQIGHLRDR
jgi:hypothetical protein